MLNESKKPTNQKNKCKTEEEADTMRTHVNYVLDAASPFGTQSFAALINKLRSSILTPNRRNSLSSHTHARTHAIHNVDGANEIYSLPHAANRDVFRLVQLTIHMHITIGSRIGRTPNTVIPKYEIFFGWMLFRRIVSHNFGTHNAAVNSTRGPMSASNPIAARIFIFFPYARFAAHKMMSSMSTAGRPKTHLWLFPQKPQRLLCEPIGNRLTTVHHKKKKNDERVYQCNCNVLYDMVSLDFIPSIGSSTRRMLTEKFWNHLGWDAYTYICMCTIHYKLKSPIACACVWSVPSECVSMSNGKSYSGRNVTIRIESARWPWAYAPSATSQIILYSSELEA